MPTIVLVEYEEVVDPVMVVSLVAMGMLLEDMAVPVGMIIMVGMAVAMDDIGSQLGPIGPSRPAGLSCVRKGLY
jgi:hypothetical protein